MKITRSAYLLIAGFLMLGCFSTVVNAAKISRTWVSRGGNDANPCTQASPCLTFASALTNTSDGGSINCLDAGDYSNAFRINISVTIDCRNIDGVITINYNTGDGVTIEAPGKTVVLRGLAINASGAAAGSDVGIHIGFAKNVMIEDCVVRGFLKGISDERTEAGTLIVQNTSVTNNNFSQSSGGGIIIRPLSGGSSRVTLNRVTVSGNSFGIAVDGSGSTADINTTIADSVIASNLQDGIVATTSSGGSPVGVYVKSSKVTNNSIGVRSIATNVTIRVDDSSVIGNGTGLSSVSGGTLLSFGNNAVQANGVNGSFSGAVTFN